MLTAGEIRLMAQATLEPAASMVGPPSTVVVDFRLDDGALAHLMATTDGVALQRILRAYLGATAVDRALDADDFAEDRLDVIDDSAAILAEMGQVFDQHGDRYESLLAAEGAVIDGIGAIGPNAIEIRYTVDAQDRVLYEEANAASVSRARARVAVELYDDLFELADDLDGLPEQIVGYALLGVVPQERTDLRLDLEMDMDDTWAQGFSHYRQAGYEDFESLDVYVQGDQVTPIQGGMFDVDALINVDR